MGEGEFRAASPPTGGREYAFARISSIAYILRVTFTAPPLFALLADPTRLRCVVLLQREGELCVCELVHALDLPQPKVSRHLALLREAGVVEDRRAGQWVHYRLHPCKRLC